jgi:hypothetical protein
MSRPPFYNHPTIGAVAKVLHDRYHVEGGVALLRRAARIRLAVAGTGRDENRVALAVEREFCAPTSEIVDEIIAAVQDAADES